MAYTVRGGELTARRKDTVSLDTVFSVMSEIDDEWYATITAKYDSGEPVIVVPGPFTDQEEARAHNRKWLELARRRGELNLVNMNTVPAEARKEITDQMLRGWRQGDFERMRSWKGGDDIDLDLSPKN